ncbi:MAG: UDP-N-acetylmuramoyl-L-alanine--D-glutamate ligase [Pseudomonadota bacterium]
MNQHPLTLSPIAPSLRSLNGQRVLVVGLGESGLAMVQWLTQQGAVVRVLDHAEQPAAAKQLVALQPPPERYFGAARFSHAECLHGVDLIALSPGVPLRSPLLQAALASGIALVSEIELFVCGLRQYIPRARLIAITGSNGKTTTTALTGKLCAASGQQTMVAGNISPSALDALMQVLAAQACAKPLALPEIWVLELSSFQLETSYTLNADVATVLNLSPDHLDRYAGMAEYSAAKARIFQQDATRPAGIAVINRDDAACQALSTGSRQRVSFGLNPPPSAADYGVVDGFIVHGETRLVACSALRLVGQHNIANAMAALALSAALEIPTPQVLPTLVNFAGLPHRVAFVARVADVDYYDDSKGTNVGASLAAIEGLIDATARAAGHKIVVILGGEGKGQDFAPLASALHTHARAVALMGRSAQAIAAILPPTLVQQICHDMDEAVRWSAAQAQAGDRVLLSPACASFDLYRNYVHRAEVFIDAVRRLQNGADLPSAPINAGFNEPGAK